MNLYLLPLQKPRAHPFILYNLLLDNILLLLLQRGWKVLRGSVSGVGVFVAVLVKSELITKKLKGRAKVLVFDLDLFL